MPVMAKFKVANITEHEGGLKTATLHPVYGDSEENKKFFKATPSGQIQLGMMNEHASQQFTPGRVFFVQFYAEDETIMQEARSDSQRREDEYMGGNSWQQGGDVRNPPTRAVRHDIKPPEEPVRPAGAGVAWAATAAVAGSGPGMYGPDQVGPRTPIGQSYADARKRDEQDMPADRVTNDDRDLPRSPSQGSDGSPY